MNKYTKLLSIVFLSSLFLPSIAKAQTNILDGELSFNAKILSDYRFRGVSKTDNDIAFQGGVDFFSDSGLYTGAWLSNVSNFGGADLETNLYVGYSTEKNGIIYDVGVTAYVYPGGNNSNYIETYGSVGFDFGLLSSSVGIAYMPSQSNLGDQDNVYFFSDTRGDIPDTPFSVEVHLGYEDGAFGAGKWDWKLGTSVTIDKFELGIAYVDTNVVGKRSDSGVIFSLGAYF